MAYARLARARGGREVFLADVCITLWRSAMTIARHVKNASLALIALSSVGLFHGAHATGTVSGTVVNNTATVDYSVGGVAQAQLTSPTATFTVDSRVDFTVTEVGGAANPTYPGVNNVIATFRVSNTGNSTQGYALSVANQTTATPQGLSAQDDDLDVNNLRVFVDDGSGTYDAADTAVNIGSLVNDANRLVFVLADIPAGLATSRYANVRLTARATVVNTTTLVTESASNTAGVDTVIADAGRDNSESALDTYDVGVTLTLTKSVALISDPLNATTNPKAIPGAVMEYTIVVSNASTTQPADAVTVTDNIPAGTTFVLGSIDVNGTVDATDSQFQNGPPARVVANAGTVPVRVGATNGTSTVKFRVTIN
jgi:uncharacterized repeat protein (TIGR01451 family)